MGKSNNKDTQLKENHNDYFFGYSLWHISILEQINQVSDFKGYIILIGEKGTGKETIARLICKSHLENSEMVKKTMNEVVKDKGILFSTNTFASDCIFLNQTNHYRSKFLEQLYEQITHNDLKQKLINKKLILSFYESKAANYLSSKLKYESHQILETIPLKKRNEDFALLVDFYSKIINKILNKNVEITEPAINFLMNMSWERNIDGLIETLEKIIKHSKSILVYPNEIKKIMEEVK